jgi:hypothetical protein
MIIMIINDDISFVLACAVFCRSPSMCGDANLWTFCDNFFYYFCRGWYGYLDRSGRLTSRVKGGPGKTLFQTAKCLLWLEQTLHHVTTVLQEEI